MGLKRHTTIDQLRVFVALTKTLNYTDAAESLGLSKSIVSKWIKQLEGDFGFALFERNNRNVMLTEQGKEVLPYVKTSLRLLDMGLKTAATK